jgi:hypothetical protein
MPEWDSLGKLLLIIGSIIALLGVLFLLADRMGMANPLGWLGKLPGDFSIKRDNFHFYFPLGTSILLSMILSLIFYLVSWLSRR